MRHGSGHGSICHYLFLIEDLQWTATPCPVDRSTWCLQSLTSVTVPTLRGIPFSWFKSLSLVSTPPSSLVNSLWCTVRKTRLFRQSFEW